MKQCFPLTPAAGPNKQGEYAYNTWEGEIQGMLPPSQQTPRLSITVAQGSYPIPSDWAASLPTPAASAIHPTRASSVCKLYRVETTNRALTTNRNYSHWSDYMYFWPQFDPKFSSSLHRKYTKLNFTSSLIRVLNLVSSRKRGTQVEGFENRVLRIWTRQQG